LERGAATIETLKAWQCVGCGRLEAPQNCIGVCRDRKVDLVYASELEASERRLADARDAAGAMHAFLRQLVGTTPRDARWEASYRSMQERARALIARFPVSA
jgi:hypothetical protein